MTTTDDERPTGDATAAETALEVDEVPADESVASMTSEADAADYERHPYRERFVIPFLLPLLIVVGIVFYVLNVSRIFLASKGTGAIVIAATITVAILFGAALLSNAPGMRTSSLALIVVGALAVISAMGWLVVGHAEEKKTAAVVLGPPVGAVQTEALAALRFQPNTLQAPFDPAHPTMTVINVSLKDTTAGQHTLQFDDPTVVWTDLVVNNAGEVKTEKAGFPKAGTYKFHCTVPGHAAAGMTGELTITNSLKPQKVAGGSGGSSSSSSTP
jgi:plastocyanin